MLNNGTFTLSSGLYIFEAGLQVSGPTDLLGSGVLLYIGHGQHSACGSTTPSLSISNKQRISLSPWNGGAYAGTNVAIWEPGSVAMNISSQTDTNAITGVLYAPTAAVNLSSGLGTLTIGAVIAKTVNISGNGTVRVG
jgi:hypothetical protein